MLNLVTLKNKFDIQMAGPMRNVLGPVQFMMSLNWLHQHFLGPPLVFSVELENPDFAECCVIP